MKKNRYYIIEPLDIDGDKNADGFLISQYRLDKYGNKIFLKNKYITYELAKQKIKDKKGGNKINNQPEQQLVVMTNEQFNKLMNNQPYNQQPYNQQPYNQQPYNQQPPPIAIRDDTSFGQNMSIGFSRGLGFAAADMLVSAVFGE